MTAIFGRWPLLALLGLLMAGAEKKRPEQRIWVLGDSIGVGIAGALRRAGVPFSSSAFENATARQWVPRLRDMAPESNRLAVVSLGTNDSVDAALRKEFATNAEQIVTQLRAIGCRVLWILPPSTSSMIPSQLDIERLTPLDATFVQARVDMSDTWHPTASGYDYLARIVLEQAKKQ